MIESCSSQNCFIACNCKYVVDIIIIIIIIIIILRKNLLLKYRSAYVKLIGYNLEVSKLRLVIIAL
jgi:hypothetical protein